jgi:hypothetical protein
MLARPETQELHIEIAATIAQLNASRDDVIAQIIGTRKLIAESRALIARVNVVLAQR